MKVSLVSIPVADPAAAHAIYTEQLGFDSVQFEPDQWLAVVSSPDVSDGPGLLLEPVAGTFAETYQKSAYEANLPIMIFESQDVEGEMQRMADAGVKLRPDLDRPDYGLTNLFEDGCGNLLMLSQTSSAT